MIRLISLIGALAFHLIIFWLTTNMAPNTAEVSEENRPPLGTTLIQTPEESAQKPQEPPSSIDTVTTEEQQPQQPQQPLRYAQSVLTGQTENQAKPDPVPETQPLPPQSQLAAVDRTALQQSETLPSAMPEQQLLLPKSSESAPKSATPALEQTPAEAPPFGQFGSTVDLTGVVAPRLQIKIAPAMISDMVREGAAVPLATLRDGKKLLLTKGTLERPKTIQPLTRQNIGTIAIRKLTLTIEAMPQAYCRSLQEWGDIDSARIDLHFTSEFDKYLISRQLDAVKHLPQEQHGRVTTLIEIVSTPQGLRAAATLTPSITQQ